MVDDDNRTGESPGGEQAEGGDETASAGRKILVSQPESVPEELRQRAQWVVWRYELEAGQRKKVPYNPATNTKAHSTKPATWATFAQALWALHMGAGRYQGLGYMLSADDPYTCIDLDHCRDPEMGELEDWAAGIVRRMDTYAELSPSGTGIHLWLRGAKRRSGTVGQIDGHKVEIYDGKHYLTMTGHHFPGTPETIAGRQDELDALYTGVFGAPRGPFRAFGGEPAFDGKSGSKRNDEDVIEWALRGVNGDRFKRLWDGDTSGNDDDHSKADMALCGILAFYTCDDAGQIDRLFRQSGLYRDKWERDDYRERTIETAIQDNSSDCPQRRTGVGGGGRTRPVIHPHDWQRREESAWERNRLLARASNAAKERVRAYFADPGPKPLVIALPPGAGKSRAVSELGSELDVAWIAERHDMVGSITNLREIFRPIEGCSADNCPEYRRHEALAKKGRNTFPMHREHDCAYVRQHREEGSAVYQIAHVPTSYPQTHAAIVVDELNLPSWLPDRVIRPRDLRAASNAPEPTDEVRRLLMTLRNVIEGAEDAQAMLHGRVLLDAWDRELGGRGELATLAEELARNPHWLDSRPVEDPRLGLNEIEALPPVVVPFVLGALQEELPNWRAGGGNDWNGRMRVAHGEHGWALYLVEPRRFPVGGEGSKPVPWAVLDATADAELLGRLFGTPVEVVREEVDPPPHTRHISVRTRYPKGSLTTAKHASRERERVASQARYLLRRLDPSGTVLAEGRVGLITYQGAEGPLGDLLGIPEGRRCHFWGVRGSNALEDCDILLVVGTPTPNLDMIMAWARALYRDDAEPIDTTTETIDGRKQFRDKRLRHLADYLTNAELTQAAHRNRPLRHDGRTVVTLSAGTVDYLPITEEYVALPILEADGSPRAEVRHAEAEERMAAAYQRLREHGAYPSERAINREMRTIYGSGLASSTVQAWLRERDAGTNTTPPRVAESA